MTHSLTMKTEKTSMCNSEWVREAARQAAAAAAATATVTAITTTATNSQAQRVSTVNTKKKNQYRCSPLKTIRIMNNEKVTINLKMCARNRPLWESAYVYICNSNVSMVLIGSLDLFFFLSSSSTMQLSPKDCSLFFCIYLAEPIRRTKKNLFV